MVPPEAVLYSSEPSEKVEMKARGRCLPAMIADIHRILLERLQQHGVDITDSALLRDLSKILESHPGIDPAAASLRLQMLGWNGLKLDYHSFQLAQAWMEFKKREGDPK